MKTIITILLASLAFSTTVFGASTAKVVRIEVPVDLDTSEVKLVNDKITTSIENYLSESFSSVYPKVQLRVTPIRMMNEMDRLVENHLEVIDFSSSRIWPGFSSKLYEDLVILDEMTFEGSSKLLSEEEVYINVQSQLSRVRIRATIELGLFTNQNLYKLINSEWFELEDDQIASLANAGKMAKHALLDLDEIRLSQATIELRLKEDRSALVLNPEEPNVATFDLSAEEEVSLLASIDDGFSVPLIERRKSVDIPTEIKLGFAPGEFLLLPTAKAFVEEISDMMLSYPQLNVMVSPTFEAVPAQVTARRVRSVRVKLKRMGIDNSRILSSKKKIPDGTPVIRIRVGNN